MIEPLNIAVCEDTKSDQEKLKKILDSCDIPVNYFFFDSGKDFLKNYKSGAFDLLLSDIFMEGLTGVELATKIREKDQELPIAFITTSQDFTLEGYRLKVFRYIEKPYNPEKIYEILEAAKIRKDSLPALHIYKNKKDIKIPYYNIIYIEQQSRNVLIHTKSGQTIEIIDKLSKFSYLLDFPNFFEAHKSFYVNLFYVRSIDVELKCFVMHDGANVPIRRENFSNAKKVLENFLFSKTREGV